jgi:hypothetical protein
MASAPIQRECLNAGDFIFELLISIENRADVMR